MTSQEIKASPKTQAVAEQESTKNETYYSPMVDIFETPKAVTVIADIPGVRQEQVELSLDDNVLTIHATMSAERPAGRILLEEYEHGHYVRRFSVAESIDQDKIEASLTNGVLQVILPKLIPAQPKKITVKVG
ncbi:Hsp20/alpha crystallin family protein [Desulfogranum mediterraneum]|uniref:Hsp20/alpha crystallin family protein n=1 Tax=Desulfogranum mediterraneum TaxID=160661 RepID=UPI00041EA176|nr:Hsp20/alpha crystallin family protein [Desulfogranum mediterraneum]